MKLTIIEKTADEVRVEFEGESHTILNLLRTELLADDRVAIVTYDTKFPIMDNPVFRLKTKGADPIAVMREAASRISSQYEEFSALYAEAVK
ncbi:MAG: DNA-directed RNA polymerase subunit L [Methanotrichaceae archaeon]|nr:DNA-directed RNA polymerase subunit L [Methanotrichaceae archaeon]